MTAPSRASSATRWRPTKVTDASGWLWAWALAIPENAPDKDAAWQYVKWATGPQYLQDAGWSSARRLGHRAARHAPVPLRDPRVPGSGGGLRAEDARRDAGRPHQQPRRQPRPGLPGVQFVGVPQFQDVGTRCTEEFSAAIAGQKSVDDALAACQEIASAVEGDPGRPDWRARPA